MKWLLIVLLGVAWPTMAQEAPKLKVGDEAVNGSFIQPFKSEFKLTLAPVGLHHIIGGLMAIHVDAAGTHRLIFRYSACCWLAFRCAKAIRRSFQFSV